MHSSKKIEEAYPGYGDAIRELYTGSYNDRPLSRNRTVTKMLNSVIYDDFINVTSNEFIIFGCRYMNTGCLKNWTMEFTRFGKCAVFNPDVDTIGEKTAVGRKASLSIVVGYNQSDANVGWYSFLSGVTMYYSSPSESFLDPLNSLSLPPETVPMLSVVQVNSIVHFQNSLSLKMLRFIEKCWARLTQPAFKITRTFCRTFPSTPRTVVFTSVLQMW